jgi:hypothetical protein
MSALSLTKDGPEESILQHSAKSGFVKVPCNILQKLTAELGLPPPYNKDLEKKEPYNSPSHIMQLMSKVLGPETSARGLLRIMKQTWGKTNMDPASEDILQTLGAMDIMDKEDGQMLEAEAKENKKEAAKEKAQLQQVHKFCHEQRKQVRKTSGHARSSSSSSASTISSSSSSGRGRGGGRSRGTGQGQGKATSARDKAKAKVDGSAKDRKEYAAKYWRAEAAPGKVYNTEDVKKFAPPKGKVAKHVEQGRWIGTYPGAGRISKSWTMLKSEQKAVLLVLRWLWDCHACNAGKGPGQGFTMCPFPLIFKEREIPDDCPVPHAESQPTNGKRKQKP